MFVNSSKRIVVYSWYCFVLELGIPSSFTSHLANGSSHYLFLHDDCIVLFVLPWGVYFCQSTIYTMECIEYRMSADVAF